MIDPVGLPRRYRVQCLLLPDAKHHSVQERVSPTQLWLIDDALDSQHAAKVVKYLPFAAASYDQQQYFFNEIKILQRLNQAQPVHCVKLLDEGALAANNGDQHGHYYVMRYYAQGDLAHYVSCHSLSLLDIQHYFLQLLAGVAALHQQGYVHLDIKPANFLLNAMSGKRSQLLLSDFALATPLCEAPRIAWGGTPRYMSPEQFRQTALSVQTDYYALGIILFEMLSQDRVYAATTYNGWAQQHCQQPIPLLPAHLAAFQTVLDGLLAKNSQYRFDDIQQIKSEFLQAMAHSMPDADAAD